MAVETAKRFPVRTALSGPAAGVIAARAIARAAGFENVITCDMGGTSFDVSLVADGEAALAAQTAIDFGMVVRTPMIEITTIGAGGGSIAWVDAGGILQVGPESAGSDPGPACYGQGNDRPTVTDANLVLGRINAERPIGGKLNRLLSDLDCAALEAEMRAVADETKALLARAGVSFERIDRQFELDMLYLGQTHTVAVPIDLTGRLTGESIQRAFDAAYLIAYGRLLEAIPVRVLNYRVAVTGRRPHFDMGVFAPPGGGTLEACERGARTIRVGGADLTAPVYERLELPEGAVIPGPAILEQPDTTIFIDPGLTGRVDSFGNVVITREGGDAEE